MVLNPHIDFIELMIENRLEPEIFKIETLKIWIQHIVDRGIKNYPVHFKFNTGMNRLGFKPEDVQALIVLMRSTDAVRLKSVFTHLVDSYNQHHKTFTLNQIDSFHQINKQIKEGIEYTYDTHILNTNGILNYPEAQCSQVRLGIGLFGVGVQKEVKKNLKTVLRFSTTISQITKISKGESIGYKPRIYS